MRWLAVDLGLLERGQVEAVSRVSPSSDDGAIRALMAAGGSAAGLAHLSQVQDDERIPFLVCVGNAVVRGLPTAARATVLGRSPLTGRPAEGQVGSDLAARLAQTLDVLVLEGRATRPGTLLVVGEEGQVELYTDPSLEGLDPEELHDRIVARFGDCATLRVGAAGLAGLPIAHLAAGSRPASRVGRGGLGAAFGRLGLTALVVRTAPVEGTGDPDLVRWLTGSPRLSVRALDGTFELASALGARGDLRTRGQQEVVDPAAAVELTDEAKGAAHERHGCKGCPTPCGWTFKNPDDSPRGARFSAHHALGTNLGFADFQAGAALLARCDAFGVDAKEVGAGLALLARKREEEGASVWGQLEVFEGWIDEMVEGEGEAALLGQGSEALARELGLVDEQVAASGEAVRLDGDLAVLLGSCVAVRGAEPMRSFPFLSGVDRARLASHLAPLPAPPGIEDPRSPVGKGRLLWWHENLAAGLDVTGFCAFSAAGLLADGLCTLDELAARVIAPGGSGSQAPGRELLALGESVLALQQELARRWGVGEREIPTWAEETLGQPGMLDEYRALRRGESDLHDGDLSGPGSVNEEGERAAQAATPLDPESGTVVLSAGGALAGVLGGTRVALVLSLPAPVREVLLVAEANRPEAEGWLLGRDGRPTPVVWRSGERLGEADIVHAGDCLELVLAVSGG